MVDSHLPNRYPLNVYILVTVVGSGQGEGVSLFAYVGVSVVLGAGIAEAHGRKMYTYPISVTPVISL